MSRPAGDCARTSRPGTRSGIHRTGTRLHVWPFAFDKSPDELTTYERGLLKPLAKPPFFGDSYLGWRAGIRADGRWIFFVAGD